MAFYLGSNLVDKLNITVPRDLTVENLFLQRELSEFNYNISQIGAYAFYECNSLASINLPQTISIESYAFSGCNHLTSVSLPQVISIGTSAFAFCPLVSVNLPQVTYIGGSAFESCNLLTTISLPKATTINACAFEYCSALTSIDLPLITQVGTRRTFYSCISLAEVNCPKLLVIPGSCFLQVRYSTSTTSRYGTFAYCRSLQTISVPSVSFIGATAFAYCSYLTSFIGPRVLTVGGSYITSSSKSGKSTYRHSLYGGAFERCYRLSMVSLPIVTKISTYAFAFCYNLLSLYLMGSSIPSLVTTAFYSTPISTRTTSTGGVYGSIFVPASLYNAYLTASGWSVYASRIVSV